MATVRVSSELEQTGPRRLLPDAEYSVPPPVRAALEAVFGPGSTAGVRVLYRPRYVRLHLLVMGGGGRHGSTTRPGKILTSLPSQGFFRADAHVLHEYYHVIQQWRREGMTRIGYLLHSGRRELEAREFTARNLTLYRAALERGE